MPARVRAVRRRPLAFLPSPSLTCQTRGGKAGPSGQPALSGGGAGPEGRRPGRRRPNLPLLEPVRRHAGVPGSSRPFPPPGREVAASGRPRRSGVHTAAPRRLLTPTSGAPPLRGPARRLRELATAAAFWGRRAGSSRGFVWAESIPWCDEKFIHVSD